jgi:hypothetical protein
MEMVETRPTASSLDQPACLLIAPAGCDVPSDLLDGLRSRQVRVRQKSDAPAVMADLAMGPSRILIIVEPAAVRDADTLVAAVRRYHPGVTVWQYAMQLDPPLQPWPGKPAAVFTRDEAPPLRSDPPTPQDSPAAVFADYADDEQNLEDIDQPESPLLTEEELAMLLGDDEEGAPPS